MTHNHSVASDILDDIIGTTVEQISMIETDFIVEKEIGLINAGSVLCRRKLIN